MIRHIRIRGVFLRDFFFRHFRIPGFFLRNCRIPGFTFRFFRSLNFLLRRVPARHFRICRFFFRHIPFRFRISRYSAGHFLSGNLRIRSFRTGIISFRMRGCCQIILIRNTITGQCLGFRFIQVSDPVGCFLRFPSCYPVHQIRFHKHNNSNGQYDDSQHGQHRDQFLFPLLIIISAFAVFPAVSVRHQIVYL